MPYAWDVEAERTMTSARMPRGLHRCRVAKVLHGNKNGKFRSEGGDPQMMLVFQNAQAQETSLMVTLSDRAGWVLARLMGCFDPPMNLAKMTQDGVEPRHFENEEWCAAQLLGRVLTIEVEYETNREGKEYPRVTPIKVQPGGANLPPLPSTTASYPPAAPRSLPPAPPAPPPPAVSQPPVPENPPPPPEMTKDEAWAHVLSSWGDDPEM